MHLHLWIKIQICFPLHLKIRNETSQRVICIRKPWILPPFLCRAAARSVTLRLVWSVLSVFFEVFVRVPACARAVAVSSDRRCQEGGCPRPLLKTFTVCPCREKGKQTTKKGKSCTRLEEGEGVRLPSHRRPPPPSSASVSSLVVVLLLLFAVGQRRAGADLPVAVQPLLHHLRDERVVAAAGALLKGHQDPTLRHAAVQPLPQQPLLLLLITHLERRRCVRTLDSGTEPRVQSQAAIMKNMI